MKHCINRTEYPIKLKVNIWICVLLIWLVWYILSVFLLITVWQANRHGLTTGQPVSAINATGKTQHWRVNADLSFLNCSWRDEDLREGVHGSLDWIALDPRHRVQDLLCEPGLVSQGIQDWALLLSTKRTHNTQVLRNNRLSCTHH